MAFTQHHQLPPNLPVAIPEDVGRGWRRVSIGERVKPWFQHLGFAPAVGWRLTVCSGIVHDGRTTYRCPASLWAWVVVVGHLTRRAWRTLLKRR